LGLKNLLFNVFSLEQLSFTMQLTLETSVTKEQQSLAKAAQKLTI
jgi:hypothetical protein